MVNEFYQGLPSNYANYENIPVGGINLVHT